jgi:hypothetical protein
VAVWHRIVQDVADAIIVTLMTVLGDAEVRKLVHPKKSVERIVSAMTAQIRTCSLARMLCQRDVLVTRAAAVAHVCLCARPSQCVGGRLLPVGGGATCHRGVHAHVDGERTCRASGVRKRLCTRLLVVQRLLLIQLLESTSPAPSLWLTRGRRMCVHQGTYLFLSNPRALPSFVGVLLQPLEPLLALLILRTVVEVLSPPCLGGHRWPDGPRAPRSTRMLSDDYPSDDDSEAVPEGKRADVETYWCVHISATLSHIPSFPVSLATC